MIENQANLDLIKQRRDMFNNKNQEMIKTTKDKTYFN